MKIGLITMHFQDNYGAVLQTYATQNYLSCNHEVEIINYIHNSKTSVGSESIAKRLVRASAHPLRTLYNRRRGKLFSEFKENYYRLSGQTYYGDTQIETDPPQYDLYVAGSDQIWNTEITNASRAYYLSFVRDGKKVSYASSFGHENLKGTEVEFAMKYLSSFDSVSVRENGSAIELERILSREIATVLDPVFLLDSNHWSEITREVKVKKNYIFIYSVQFNDAIRNAADAAARMRLPIYYLNGGGTSVSYPGKELVAIGPREFLWLIMNAKYIITNSFHGTAFSLIFKKKLVVCEHTTRNLRLKSLLKRAHVDQYMIYGKSTINELDNSIIDGEKAVKHLDTTDSRLFLETAIDK